MRSLNSACSAFLCSVASATDLSNAPMPACKAAISSVRVAIPSSALSIAVSSSDTVRSSAFFLSSAESSCTPQYSFLLSSSVCSCFKVATISSIILMTFSKPIFLPVSARAMKSILTRSPWGVASKRRTSRARLRRAAALSATCTKLAEALGKVFLKSSSASSSLRTLMVSDRVTSSSALVLTRSSHSAVLVEQLFSKLALNSLSARRASSVSVRSFFNCSIFTPRSPTF
mmetsp:Transcript_25631/g.59645  ORF Transcript_25631/g.59645 Transcript_25631/m.59645 type:complete len:230 (-) Transcript_25631:837-1526(-)